MRTFIAALLVAMIASPADAQGDLLPGGMSVRELYSIINERDRQYTQRFDAQEKAVAAALAAAKEAVVKAEGATEKRFDSVNEFRNTLKDQQQTLLPRNEAELRFKTVIERLAALETINTQAIGRTEGASWLWSIMLALAGAFGGLVIGGAAVAGLIMRAKGRNQN